MRNGVTTLACVALLAGTTATIFWRHLVLDYTFPYDYTATTRWAVFLTSTVATEHFTEWNPFAGGGIALPYNALSGLYFPLWWIMSYLQIPATISTLTLLQVAHVFIGGLGTFALTRSLEFERRWALVAAMGFLLFGGIYSNGSHDVILRGHSYAPWLLWCLTPPRDGRGWVRILALPLLVWLLATGGYTGQAVAFLQVAAVYAGAHLVMHRQRRREYLGYLALALAAALAVTGAVYYPAAAADRAGDLYRAFAPSAVMRSVFALQLRDAWGLYLDSFAWGFAVATVTGWAVGVVVLIGATCVSRAQLRRHIPLAAAGVTALALAALPAWLPAGKVMASLPLLFPSRLPASDSKAMVGIALAYFATLGWQRIAASARPRVLPLAAGAVLLAGIPTAPQSSGVEPAHYPWAIVVLVAGTLALVYFGPAPGAGVPDRIAGPAVRRRLPNYLRHGVHTRTKPLGPSGGAVSPSRAPRSAGKVVAAAARASARSPSASSTRV